MLILPSSPSYLQWGSDKNLLAANCGQIVQILTKHTMNVHYNQQVYINFCFLADGISHFLNLHAVKLSLHRCQPCRSLPQSCWWNATPPDCYTPSTLTYKSGGPTSPRYMRESPSKCTHPKQNSDLGGKNTELP